MDIVVIKFVAAFFSIKGKKKKKRGEYYLYMQKGMVERGGGREKRRRKYIKEGYVISDTFFATLLPRTRSNRTLEFVIRKVKRQSDRHRTEESEFFPFLSLSFLFFFFLFFFLSRGRGGGKHKQVIPLPFSLSPRYVDAFYGSLITSLSEKVIPRRINTTY